MKNKLLISSTYRLLSRDDFDLFLFLCFTYFDIYSMDKILFVVVLFLFVCLFPVPCRQEEAHLTPIFF